jgi:hypothetical protein
MAEHPDPASSAGEHSASGEPGEHVEPGERTASGEQPPWAPDPSGPAHHEAPLVDDRIVPRRVFLFIGVFVALLASLYWFTSYEDAGSVLLLLSAVLALWFGTYLWLAQRRLAAGGAEAEDEGSHYLPAASAWPLAIGLGAATVANGLVLGIWVTVPGVAILGLGIGGLIHQSRHRL